MESLIVRHATSLMIMDPKLLSVLNVGLIFKLIPMAIAFLQNLFVQVVNFTMEPVLNAKAVLLAVHLVINKMV